MGASTYTAGRKGKFQEVVRVVKFTVGLFSGGLCREQSAFYSPGIQSQLDTSQLWKVDWTLIISTRQRESIHSGHVRSGGSGTIFPGTETTAIQLVVLGAKSRQNLSDSKILVIFWGACLS